MDWIAVEPGKPFKVPSKSDHHWRMGLDEALSDGEEKREQLKVVRTLLRTYGSFVKVEEELERRRIRKLREGMRVV